MRREIFHADDGKEGKIYYVNVLEIKINLNLNALTLEQLRESRKTMAIDFARGLLQESEGLLSGNDSISMDQVSAKLMKIRDLPANHFNDIHNFRAAINELFFDWQREMEYIGDILKIHARQSLFDVADQSNIRLVENPALRQAIEIFKRLQKTEKLEELNTLQQSTANSNTSDAEMAKMMIAKGDSLGTALEAQDVLDDSKTARVENFKRALKTYESALTLVKEDKSAEAQKLVPVLCRKKGGLLLQTIKNETTLDTSAQNVLEEALGCLAEGLAATGAGAQFSLIRAEILEDVGALMIKHPGDIPDSSLGIFQANIVDTRETSASSLLLEALAVKVDTLGLECVSSTSKPLFAHLAALGEDKASASADQGPLSCRVFETLSKGAISEQAPQGQSSNAGRLLKIAKTMEDNATADSTAASSCIQEWGARAVSSVLKGHGPSADADVAPITEVVRVLTNTAKMHQRNALVSAEVCKALLPALQALRGTVQDADKIQFFNVNQAISMLVAALDLHKDDLHVRSQALQVRVT